MPEKREGSRKWQAVLHLDGRKIRIPGYRSKKATAALEQNLRTLAELRQAGARVPPKLAQYVAGLEERIRRRLVGGTLRVERGAGPPPLARPALVSKAQAAPQRLVDLLELWKQSMLDDGRTPHHAKQTTAQARRAVEAMGCERAHDLELDAVRRHFQVMGRRGAARTTVFNCAGSLKSFSTWLFREGHHPEDLLARYKRPARDTGGEQGFFTLEEQRAILRAALDSGEEVLGYTGRERALWYLVSLSSGLRRRESWGLLVRDVDLERRVIRLRGVEAKNGKDAFQPLSASNAALLGELLSARLPTQPLIARKGRKGRATPPDTAALLRHDREFAGVSHEDERGDPRDFKALRNTYGANLALAGTWPTKLQRLMRHSDINLTMRIYVRLGLDETAGEVEKVPGYGLVV